MKIEVEGLGIILTMFLTTLKLCEIINWSWWWVFSPLWIPIILMGMLVLVLAFFAK